MILATTIQSEKGKETIKTANEFIKFTLTQERRQKFDITFTGDTIEVLRYSDGTTDIIPYMPCELCGWGEYRKCIRCSK